MKGNVFLDSNILIYGYSVTEKDKQKIVLKLMESADTVVSTQVIQELSNVFRKKFSLHWSNILAAITEIEQNHFILQNNLATIRKAIEVAEKYQYSFYDSLIVASAIEANCDILYSEDLHHNQIAERKLRIINPFK